MSSICPQVVGGRTSVEGDTAVGCADIRGPFGQGHPQRVQYPPHLPMIRVRKYAGVSRETGPGGPARCENNYFTEMCSGSEAGPYLRLIDLVYHSTLGLRVIKKKGERVSIVCGTRVARD